MIHTWHNTTITNTVFIKFKHATTRPFWIPKITWFHHNLELRCLNLWITLALPTSTGWCFTYIIWGNCQKGYFLSTELCGRFLMWLFLCWEYLFLPFGHCLSISNYIIHNTSLSWVSIWIDDLILVHRVNTLIQSSILTLYRYIMLFVQMIIREDSGSILWVTCSDQTRLKVCSVLLLLLHCYDCEVFEHSWVSSQFIEEPMWSKYVIFNSHSRGAYLFSYPN